MACTLSGLRVGGEDEGCFELRGPIKGYDHFDIFLVLSEFCLIFKLALLC